MSISMIGIDHSKASVDIRAKFSFTKKRAVEAMKKLNNREKLILTLRFFNGKTQMEVADEIGISQAQVSRLEKTALKHMRKYV